MKVILIGPATSGKTTLFNAVAPEGAATARKGALESTAVVKVPDPRVARMSAIYNPPKTVYATVEFTDLPGMVGHGDQQAKVLTAARDAEALIEVVGLFDFGSGPRSPKEGEAELASLRTELALSDLQILERRLEKLAAQIQRRTGDTEYDKRELAMLEKVQQAIEAEVDKPGTAGNLELNAEEEKMLRTYQFLCLKPRLTVYNLDESQFADPAIRQSIEATGAVALCATLEQEIAQLSPEEQGEFLSEYGMERPASARLVQACYSVLDLISFFTIGEDEVRAWTIERGDSALIAAGKIHSDIARGFIRAEVIPYDDIIAEGDFKKAKAAGKMRLEGKDYVVQDGQIVHFRFSV